MTSHEAPSWSYLQPIFKMSPLVSKALLAELNLSMWAEAVSGHLEPSSHAKAFGPSPHAVETRCSLRKDVELHILRSMGSVLSGLREGANGVAMPLCCMKRSEASQSVAQHQRDKWQSASLEGELLWAWCLPHLPEVGWQCKKSGHGEGQISGRCREGDPVMKTYTGISGTSR